MGFMSRQDLVINSYLKIKYNQAMKLSLDHVKKVAKLANLQLSSEEEEKFSEQLSRILEYFDQLNQVDTENIEPTFNVSGQNNVMREDEPVICLSQEQALQNASIKKDGMFETKGVFEE